MIHRLIYISILCLFSSGLFAQTPVPDDVLDELEQEIIDARAYRLGFPLEKSRKNLRDNWRESDYQLFKTFVALRNRAQNLVLEPPTDTSGSTDYVFGEEFTEAHRSRALRLMRECVSEVLQGQLLVGNENLLNAGRRQFPSVVTPQMIAAIRPPYGESEDWKELAIAALDFEMGILEALDVLKEVTRQDLPAGSGTTLRSRGGNETLNTAAEDFPEYTVIGEFDEPGESGSGPFEAQSAHFVRTELNLLGALIARRGLTASAFADRIRRLAYRANNDVEGSQRHGEAGESAKEEYDRLAISRAKRDAQLMFYSGIMLRTELPKSFNGVERDDFKLHDGDRFFSALNQLNVIFKDVRDGRVPTGIADQFVPSPNKRIGGSTGYLSDAISSVTRAKESQNIAEERVFRVEQAEVSEVELNRNLRENYITQIGQITGFEVDGEAQLLVDPIDENNTFDLSIQEKKEEFKELIGERVASAFSQISGSASGVELVSEMGVLGNVLLRIQQARINGEIAADGLEQIPAAIERVEEKASAANAISSKFTARENDLVKKYAIIEGVLSTTQVIARSAVAASVATTQKDAALATASGVIEAAATAARAVVSGKKQKQFNLLENEQNTELTNIDAEFKIKELSAQINGARLQVDAQQNNAALVINELSQTQRQLSDLIENFAIYREDTADLWFLDPSLVREATDAEEQAEADLADCVATLYDLTRALEFYWTEPFQNPLQDVEGGIVTLPRFADDFTEIDDLYAITDAYDAEKYLNALGFNLSGGSAAGWDSTLRALRQSIPAQNQTVVISVREDLLGLKVPERAYVGDTLEVVHNNGVIEPGMEDVYAELELEKIQEFRNELQEGRRDAFDFAFGTGRDPLDFLPGFELVVSTSEKSNYLFDAREWNARIETIQVDVRTEGGFIPPGQEENFIRVNMIQEGTIMFRRSFPLELAAADYARYQTEFRYRSDRLRISPFEFPIQAGINGSSGLFGGQPAALPYFFSPFCTNWRLVVDPMASPANNYADLNKIKDIRIIMTMRSGIPPTISEGL